MNSKNNFLRSLGMAFRVIFILLLVLSFFTATSTRAAGLPNLTINMALNGGNLIPLETGRTYTITVSNIGDVPTTGPATVVFSHVTVPAGLTVTAISGTDWNCTLGTLTCTRSDVLNNGASYPVITVTVTVLVGALPSITSQAVVSGGGADDDPDNNTSSLISNVNAKADLLITGYQLLNANKSEVITVPEPNQTFWVRMTIQNRGGVGGGVSSLQFYPGVFLDDKPNFGPDHDSAGITLPPGYPVTLTLGETTDYQGYKVTGPTAQDPAGCVYYDPNNHITPANTEVLTEAGNYRPVSFLPGLAAGATSTYDVEIAYPLADYVDPMYDNIRTGLPAGSYNIYLYADPKCNVNEITENNNSYGPITVNIGTRVDVTIGGNFIDDYFLASAASQRVNYPTIDAGPVKIESTNGAPIIAALREAWNYQGTGILASTSFAQIMGLPAAQLSDTYYLPHYNDLSPLLDAQLRIGNVDTTTATVAITIGGVLQETVNIAPGASYRVNYPTLDAGPVKVESTNNMKIVVALREAWNNQGTGILASTSFAQIMGLPAEQLSDTYYLPHYNDLSPLLDAQLRIGNVDTTTATVAITIGGVLQETVNIAPGASYRVNYPTIDAGPVKVESTDNKKIVVALREAWNNQGTGILASTSFAQIMGLPAEQLSDTYYLPHYNDLSPLLDAQLRIGNVDTTTATVAITIGGVLQETVNIAPGASYRVNYSTLDAGPVKVESTDNKKIVVALREAWNNQGTGILGSTSFTQLMGLPMEALSSIYYLPHYNDLSPLLDAQLRFGVP